MLRRPEWAVRGLGSGHTFLYPSTHPSIYPSIYLPRSPKDAQQIKAAILNLGREDNADEQEEY